MEQVELVEQLAVFLENRSGRLAEITAILAQNDINIRALSVADAADFGILRLVVDKVDAARDALKASGFQVNRTQVVAVAVPDKVGGLAKVLATMGNAGINVEYMYAYANEAKDDAIMLFRFDAMDKAVGLLQSQGFTLVSMKDICAQ